jgi:hypothetical protein
VNNSPDLHATWRRTVYCLLIVLATASMTGRILAVKSSLGGTPLLSANDRSRWATVRSLVDLGTYQIDDVIYRRGGQRDREWYTIDMVRHRGRDGHEHYYSSKPPLLATILAGKYWLLQQFTGATLAERPFYVVRALLLTTNVLPLVLYFAMLAALVERIGVTDWGRVFVMAIATWGTFLTTFAVTLNNHLPAAISLTVAVYAALRAARDGKHQLRYFALAGGSAAFTVANELPALSFFALLAIVLLWQFPRPTLLGFVPAAGFVAVAFFATNFMAHQSWRPPYAHRQDGPLLAMLDEDVVFAADATEPGEVSEEVRENFPVPLSQAATISAATSPGRWLVWDSEQQRRWVLVRGSKSGELEVRGWDNWYEYDGSYWTDERRSGVDRGEASQLVYGFHMTFGHRGIFSLTPVWLISVMGIGVWLARGDRTLRTLAAIVAITTLVCATFYVSRPLIDRNYGGVAAGFRWMFWFTPLWLLTAIPAADAIGRSKAWRGFAWVLLAISVVSATYPSQNPWSQSWIFEYWSNLGWIQY